MKKQLQHELTALAKRIIQNTDTPKISVSVLKTQAQDLYEKLSILEFTEKSLDTLLTSESQQKEPEHPESQTIEQEEGSPEQAIPEISQEDESEHYTPDGTEFSEQEAITEPNTEKIKDIVAQMPPESDQIDQMLSTIFPKVEKREIEQDREKFTQVKERENDTEEQKHKQTPEEEFGVHFDRLPLFEPISAKQNEQDRPKSVNDQLKKAIHIGLNDRHAFVKHLFGGSTSDYNRVLSQLNTHKSKEEALEFIEQMVKPDYNNWEGKELYENRFLKIIENRFA